MKAISKILCPLDLSDVSGQIADYAAMQARLSNAEVLVMYVAPALNQYSDTEMPYPIIKNFIAERVENAQTVMKTFVPQHFPDVKVQSIVVSGYPPDSILDAITEHGADMVVIGTHGRRGVNAAVFGSVAEKVVKQSPVPVLVVRPKAGK